MPKPINLAYADFKEKLVALVNESGLPMFMVAECLSLVLDKVQEVAAAQLEQARKAEEDASDKTDNAETS